MEEKKKTGVFNICTYVLGIIAIVFTIYTMYSIKKFNLFNFQNISNYIYSRNNNNFTSYYMYI